MLPNIREEVQGGQESHPKAITAITDRTRMGSKTPITTAS
jgi:hypothetical protein